MKRILSAGLLAMAIAACGGSENSAQLERTASPPAPVPQALAYSADGASGGGLQGLRQADEAPAEPVQGAEQYIAYTYSLGLRLPQAEVEPLMEAHVAACREAGPAVCIVTTSNLNNQSDDYTTGYLSLRAVPDWIETFLGGVDAETEAAGGEVTSRNTQAVDLTRVILDTDARLSAQVTLKGRLEDLLANREGELGDFLQIERELARVTGEIESLTSNLKALRLRVSMSEMSL
ncbi:MAG: DUF4349 domain-containing protein [Pseudomonadota bacterium]